MAITSAQIYFSSALVTSVAAAFLLLFISLRATDRRLAKIFCFYIYVIMHWSLSVFICTYINNHEWSYFFCMSGHYAALFIPVAFLHFVLEYTNANNKMARNILNISYFLSVSFFILILLNQQKFIPDVVPKLTFNYFPNPGPLYAPWMLFFVALVGISMFFLILDIRCKVGVEQKAGGFFLGANLLGYLGSIGCFLPVYDISTFPFPFGALGVFLFSVVTGFAVMRYQLIDLERIVRRATVFAGLFAF